MVFRRAIRRAIIAQGREAAPAECCGLLIGTPRSVEYAVAMGNASRDPHRYQVDDLEHIHLRRDLRRFMPEVDIVGVYHSHAASAAIPSASDLAEAFYPDWIYVVVGLGSARPSVRGFRIRDGRAHEVTLEWRSELVRDPSSR